MADTLSTLAAVGVGFLGTLLVQFIQVRQNREAHKRQLERDEAAHKQQLERDQQAHTQQLERDRQEYKRKQIEAQKERVRQEYIAALEAVTTFRAIISQAHMLRLHTAPDVLNPQIAAQLRSVFANVQNARVTLWLDDQGTEIISNALWEALENVTMLFESSPMQIAINHIKGDVEIIDLGIERLQKLLPERLAQLGLPM